MQGDLEKIQYPGLNRSNKPMEGSSEEPSLSPFSFPVFEAESCYVQGCSEFLILLPQPAKCWDCKHVPLLQHFSELLPNEWVTVGCRHRLKKWSNFEVSEAGLLRIYWLECSHFLTAWVRAVINLLFYKYSLSFWLVIMYKLVREWGQVIVDTLLRSI